MIRNITVIGGGGTGYAATAYLTMKGFEVTICDNERFTREIEDIHEQGGLLLRGRAGVGFFRPVEATTDYAKALASAELIIVCVPATRHQEVAETIAPYLRPGQNLLISPGNLGSFTFRRVFDAHGVGSGTIIAELEGNLCPCRITAKAEVTVGLPIRKKKVAALPGSRTAEFIDFCEGVLEFIPNRNVFEGALLSDNYVLHIGTSLLSAATIEAMGEDFVLFQHGLSDAAVHCVEAVRQERIRLLAAFGLTERDSATEFFEELRDWHNHPEYDVFRTLSGPDSLTHRYVAEDCRACASLALSCAHRLGVSMPTLEAIVTLASAVNGCDYLSEGRTLENLGFDAAQTVPEIVAAIS